MLDPELNDAMSLAAAHLSGSTEAARLRELALIGARSINAGDAGLERTRRALDQLGASPERGDLLVLSRRIRHRPSAARETPSESLEWVRGQR